MPVANASLLDEGNACAEAIFMAYKSKEKNKLFIDQNSYEHNINVIKTRFKYLNIMIDIGPIESFIPTNDYFAILTQQFSSDGKATDPSNIFIEAKKHNITTIISTDLLGCTLFKPPGEMNADIAVGSAQRLGVPMGFGGPSAAFISCKRIIYGLFLDELLGYQTINMATMVSNGTSNKRAAHSPRKSDIKYMHSSIIISNN